MGFVEALVVLEVLAVVVVVIYHFLKNYQDWILVHLIVVDYFHQYLGVDLTVLLL